MSPVSLMLMGLLPLSASFSALSEATSVCAQAPCAIASRMARKNINLFMCILF